MAIAVPNSGYFSEGTSADRDIGGYHGKKAPGGDYRLCATSGEVWTPKENQLAQPFSERAVAAELNGHEVVVRELRPQDIKFDLSDLTQREVFGTLYERA